MIGWHEPDVSPLKDLAQMLTQSLPDQGELPGTWQALLGPNRESLFTQAIDNWVAYEASRGVLIGDDRKQLEQLIGDEYAKAYKDIASTYNAQTVNVLNQENLRMSKVYSKAYQSIIKSYTGALSPAQQKEATKKAIIQSLILEVDQGITQWLIDKLMKKAKRQEAIAYYQALKKGRLAQSAITALAAIDLELIQQAQRDALMHDIINGIHAQKEYISSLSRDLYRDMDNIQANLALCDYHIEQLEAAETELEDKLSDLGEQLDRLAYQAEDVRKEVKVVKKQKKELSVERTEVEQDFSGFKKEAENLDKRSDEVEALIAKRLEQGTDTAIVEGASDDMALREQQRISAEIKELDNKMKEAEPMRKGFQDLKAQLELMMNLNSLSAQQIHDFAGRAERLAQKYPDVPDFARYQQYADHMMVSFVNKPSMKHNLAVAGIIADESEELRAENAKLALMQYKALADAAQILERDFVVHQGPDGQFVVEGHDASPEDASKWLEDKIFAPFLEKHGEGSIQITASEFIENHLRSRQFLADHEQDPIHLKDKDFYVKKSTYDTLFNSPLFGLGLEYGNTSEIDKQYRMPWMNLKEKMVKDESKFYEPKRALESKYESFAILVQQQVEQQIQEVYQNYDARLNTIDDALSQLDLSQKTLEQKLVGIEGEITNCQAKENELKLALMLVQETKQAEVQLKSLYEKEMDFANDLQDKYSDLQEANDQIIDYQKRIQQATSNYQRVNLERNLESVQQKKKDLTSQINNLVNQKNNLSQDIAQAKQQQQHKFDQIAKLKDIKPIDFNQLAKSLQSEPVNQAVFHIIQDIAHDFHPKSSQENSNQRVKNLVSRASDEIMRSGILEGIGEDMRQKVYEYLESDDLTCKVYQIAQNARVDHFYPLMLEDYTKLSGPEGLDWLEYPRAKRDVIDGLIGRLEADTQVKPGQITQMKEFLIRQKAAALTQDLNQIVSPQELDILARRIRSGEAMKHLPGFMKEDILSSLKDREAEMVIAPQQPYRSLVYSKIQTPEHNLTQGIKANLQARSEPSVERQPTLKDKSGPSSSR